MPGWNEQSAPKFDDSKASKLERYFVELEALLYLHNVVDQTERKQAAVKYLDTETLNLWKTTTAWDDNTKTYDEFWTEIYELYPRATGNWTYTIQDWETIIGHYAQVGIKNSMDLSEYYRKYLLITRYVMPQGLSYVPRVYLYLYSAIYVSRLTYVYYRTALPLILDISAISILSCFRFTDASCEAQ